MTKDSRTLKPSKSDQHLISPYNIIPESNIKVRRMEEMITQPKKLLIVKQILLISNLGKCREQYGENIYRYQGVKDLVSDFLFVLTPAVQNPRISKVFKTFKVLGLHGLGTNTLLPRSNKKFSLSAAKYYLVN